MVTEAKNRPTATREQNWRLAGLKSGDSHLAFQVTWELRHRIGKYHSRGPLEITHYSDEPLQVEEVDALLERLNRGRNKVNMGLVLEDLLRSYSERLLSLTRYHDYAIIDQAKKEVAPLRGAIEIVSQYVDQSTLNRLAARDVGHGVIIDEIVGHVTPNPRDRYKQYLSSYGLNW